MAKLNFYDTDAVKAFVLDILIENAELKSDPVRPGSVRRFPCGEPKPSNQIRRNRNERTFDSPSYRTRHLESGLFPFIRRRFRQTPPFTWKSRTTRSTLRRCG